MIPTPDGGTSGHVLGQFFDDGSDVSMMSSMDDMGSSYEAPSMLLAGVRRPFSRTESASTDPLSAAGTLERPKERATQRRRTDATPDDEAMPNVGMAAASGSVVDWDALVSRVFDEGREAPALLLGGCHLTYISGVVGDLRHYVAFEPRRMDTGTRTTTHRRPGPLEFYLWDNQLTRLPSALFQLSNLGVLSLRKNQLTHLPASIGQLRHLRELNIGGNALTYLPAEMQQLTLETFTYIPNPFLPVPPGARLEARSMYGGRRATTTTTSAAHTLSRWSRAHTDAGILHRTTPHEARGQVYARVLGELRRRSLPTLADMCIQRLLSDDPLVLEQYETGCLHTLRHTLQARVVERLEAARRSATHTWGARSNVHRTRDVAGRERWYAGASFTHSVGHDENEEEDEDEAVHASANDVDTALEYQDDAADNVWFQRCPCAHTPSSALSGTDWPLAEPGVLYVTPYEERMEWVSHVAGVRVAKQSIEMAGLTIDGAPADQAGCLPLLWRGCSPHCLAFLTQASVAPDAPL